MVKPRVGELSRAENGGEGPGHRGLAASRRYARCHRRSWGALRKEGKDAKTPGGKRK